MSPLPALVRDHRNAIVALAAVAVAVLVAGVAIGIAVERRGGLAGRAIVGQRPLAAPTTAGVSDEWYAIDDFAAADSNANLDRIEAAAPEPVAVSEPDRVVIASPQ